MRAIVTLVLLSLGFLGSASASPTYVIDPNQSYLSIEVPTYERGEPIGFLTNDDGSTSIPGYAWTMKPRIERFAISGKLDFAQEEVDSGAIPLRIAAP